MQWPILKRFGEPKLWTWRWQEAFTTRNIWGFLKWCYPTTICFPTKNDHFGVFWGYHHLRKHHMTILVLATISGRSTAALLYLCVCALMKLPFSQVESILNNNWQFNHYTAAVRERWGLFRRINRFRFHSAILSSSWVHHVWYFHLSNEKKHGWLGYIILPSYIGIIRDFHKPF